MNPEEYVDLSLKIMPEVIKSLKAKMDQIKEDMGNEAQENPFAFLNQLMQAMMECLAPFQEEIEASGLSLEEFNNYGNAHQAEMEEFLSNDPNLKEKIENLKAEMENLMKAD